MKQYKYGISFKCVLNPGKEHIIIGREGEFSYPIYDYVSDSTEKLIDMIVNNPDPKSPYTGDAIYKEEHKYVGLSVSNGGKVIGVFQYDDEMDEDWVICVLVEDPNYMPEIVE